jgi:hypothetical protein
MRAIQRVVFPKPGFPSICQLRDEKRLGIPQLILTMNRKDTVVPRLLLPLYFAKPRFYFRVFQKPFIGFGGSPTQSMLVGAEPSRGIDPVLQAFNTSSRRSEAQVSEPHGIE